MNNEDSDLSQLNEPEEQDLEHKLQKLQKKQFNFKRNLTKQRLHILNLVTEQQSVTHPLQPNQYVSCISNGEQSPLNQEPIISQPEDHVPESKFARLKKDGISPSVPHRFNSKKRSQFSYQSKESSNSNLELHLGKKEPFQIDSRKERSKLVRTTVKQYNQQFLLEQYKYQPPQRHSQMSLLHFDGGGGTDKSHSQSSITTPKSILKNPSSHNSSKLSILSLQIGSQLNSHSPSKKVKFCLTRRQARRENIPC